MTRCGWLTLVTVAIAILVLPGRGLGDQCEQSCGDTVLCHKEVVECLIDAARVREAIDRLKNLREKHPKEPAIGRLLAHAYLADNNAFWAERVLYQLIEENPSDCETLSWLAWVYIQGGDLEQARETMKSEKRCPRTHADHARWQVLESYMARAKGDAERARESFERLGDAVEAFPEDVEMWRHLNRKENPAWIEPISVRMMVSGGFTSDARAGSPADITGSAKNSGFGKLDLFSRFVLPTPYFFKPTVEGNLKANGLAAKTARELSYMDLSIRPGVILGRSFPRILVGYNGKLLLMGLEGKEKFSETHRGEVELETDFDLLVFAGAGRGIFREGGRTRTELDGGVGFSFAPHRYLKIMTALSGRYHFAVGDAYEKMGGSGLLVGRVDFGQGFYGRIGVIPSVDYYPKSGGDLGEVAFGTDKKRFDFSIKQFEELWSPALWGFRIGLRYEFSYRDSTADEKQSDYDYIEHRVLLNLRYYFSINPWSPRGTKNDKHVPLDYGLKSQDERSLDEERIQDLLRQDEAARASSSCVE